jgi:predicted dienelactone hydrolase
MHQHIHRRGRTTRLRRTAGAGVIGTALLSALALHPASARPVTTSGAPGASTAGGTATAEEFRRGPAPTTAALRQETGPFRIATTTVTDRSTFDGGTVYYPTDTSQGTFGALVVSPGYTARQSSIAWYGRTLASHGFVVFTIDTESVHDQPDSRGEQLLDALDHLTQRSTVRNRIDPDRLAVAGHSMGGGGALRASFLRPTLRASIPITPYHAWKNWSGTTVPTMVFGAENDTTTRVTQHAEPFYNSLGAQHKAYLELNAATHTTPTRFDATIAQYAVSWLKVHVDGDSRYRQFLCPAPRADNVTVEEYRSTGCDG